MRNLKHQTPAISSFICSGFLSSELSTASLYQEHRALWSTVLQTQIKKKKTSEWGSKLLATQEVVEEDNEKDPENDEQSVLLCPFSMLMCCSGDAH